MYAIVLFAHSWLRWLVLAVTVAALGRAIAGLIARRAWSRADRMWSVAFVALLDTQVLLGLVLYFVLSPLTPKSLFELKAAMPISAVRFFAIEHITMMLLALTAAHVTSVLCRRASDSRAKYKRLAWGIGVVILLIGAAVPWPWSPAPRPLARWF